MPAAQQHVDPHQAAGWAVSHAHRALEDFKKSAGRPEDRRTALEAEINVSLTEAQTIRLAVLADAIGDAERNLVKAASGMEKTLGNAIDALRNAGEQGTAHTETLARWTKYMVFAIAIQAVALIAQLLIVLL